MSSLVENVVSLLRDVSDAGQNETAENILAEFDIDAFDLSEIEGGWRWIALTAIKTLHDFSASDFLDDGPNIYQSNGYVFVRFSHPVMSNTCWAIFESETTGLHAA